MVDKKIVTNILLEMGYSITGINFDDIECCLTTSMTGPEGPGHYVRVVDGKGFYQLIPLHIYQIFDRDFKIDDIIG